MRDRTVFMNTLGEPNCGEKIPTIFEKHYLKFNFVYKLFDYILDFSGVEESLKKITSDHDDDFLVVDISFKKGTDLENIQELIQEFLENIDDDNIEADVRIMSSNKINISISAKFIEEEMYDENRFDSSETVHNG